MRRSLAPLALLMAVFGCDAPPASYDLIIHGVEVFDGISPQPQRVEIAISGDRIAALGDLGGARASTAINATDLTVAPGFIDVQSHSGTTLLADGAGESHLRQGITSGIIGDVDSPAFWTAASADLATLKPFGLSFDWNNADGYFDRLLKRGVAMNVGTLVPLAATDGSTAAVERAMRRGALGLSIVRNDRTETIPSRAFTELAVANHGDVVAIVVPAPVKLLDAVEEAIQIAAEARLPIVVYQPPQQDVATLAAVLARISEAREKGIDVHTTMTPDTGAAHDARAYWLRDSGASVGSQSAAVRSEGLLAGRNVHQRADDTFPTVLARYVREEQVISLGVAIQRMTSAAARQFRLDGRGVLRVGNFADIVVFDPMSVGKPAMPEVPAQYPTGIHHVIVNGVPVLNTTGSTGARPGQGLFGRGRVPAGRSS